MEMGVQEETSRYMQSPPTPQKNYWCFGKSKRLNKSKYGKAKTTDKTTKTCIIEIISSKDLQFSEKEEVI